MTISTQYEEQIRKERNYHAEKDAERRKQMEKERQEMPKFKNFCRRISKFGAAKLLNKVYSARAKAGLPPFTHAYDYPLRGNCWLAKKNFRLAGRYGANSGDVVFVPAGVEIAGWDHTIVIYVDDWERNDFVPAYSNTV